MTSNFPASLPSVNPDHTDRARPTRLRFGDFEADLVTSELFESGTKVPIQEKPFRFLAALLHRPGELVTREAMSHSLWPDIYVQVNQGLNAAARKVRMALRDDALKPKFVETLGGHGYRFIHPTEVLRWSSEVTEVSDIAVRIALLPLKYANHEEMELAGGLTQQLISLLRRIHPRILVVGGSDLSRMAAGNGQLDSIRKAMEVAYVLSGSISLKSRRIELSVGLTDARENLRVWETTYEASFQEVGRIQDEIAGRILESCRNLRSGSFARSLTRTDFPADQEYLRACHHMSRRTPDDLVKAIELLHKTTKSDARFAPAWAGLAKAYNLTGLRGLMPPRAACGRAAETARRALDLDANNPDAMEELGWSELTVDRDWALATRLLKRALLLNPNSASGYCKYAFLLMSRSRVDDAVAALEKSRRLNLLSVGLNNHLATMCYYARRYDDAIKHARFTATLVPSCPDAHSLMGLCALAQRRHSEALAHLQSAVEHSNADPVCLARLAYAEAEAGKFSVAEGLLQKVISISGPGLEPSYDIALVQLALGRVNEAFHWIEQAYQQCSHWVLLMALDPRLDILRGTKRFDQLCRMMRPTEMRKVANAN